MRRRGMFVSGSSPKNLQAVGVRRRSSFNFNKWHTDDKTVHLRWAMSDLAAQALCGTENLDLDQLVAKLSSRFGGIGIEERYQNELRCRRRGKNESLRS